MHKGFFSVVSIVCLLSFGSRQAFGWGNWGHNHINRGAVMALPDSLGVFFYNHADFINEEANVPDLRAFLINDRAENCRHYINLESYGYTSRAMMPATDSAAIAKYGKDSVNKWGILPWYIQDMMNKLTQAFRDRNKTEILFIAADLAHYIGDAHVPLHTTANHDGAATGQEGIHAFWEAQLVELFAKDYNLYTSKVHYIDDIKNNTWDIIDHTLSLVDKVLTTEFALKEKSPLHMQYVLDDNGNIVKSVFRQPVHTYEYSRRYHELLDGMIKKQLKAAIGAVASYWYTAWRNAGSPDLTQLDAENTTARNRPARNEDLGAWKKGKIKGCASFKEFPNVKK